MYLKILPRLRRSTVADIPVSFGVTNINRSRVSCPSDGAAYTVRGHLLGPSSKLDGSAAVTVYLHDLGLGEWFWRFRVPGLDYATELARAGHVSLTVDDLGYDASDRPEGTALCVGSHADVVHQIVGKLRTGSYTAAGARPVAFRSVALAGQSTGGQIAEIEAYSFQDVDALAVFGWAERGASQRAQNEFTKAGAVCASGGQRADGDAGPPGYAYFGQTDEDFRASFFNEANADATVVAEATRLRNRGPCGDFASTAPGIVSDEMHLGEIKIPVLLVYGEKDAAFPPQGEPAQRQSFSGTGDITSVVVPNSGHAFTLEHSAGGFRSAVAAWLAKRGF